MAYDANIPQPTDRISVSQGQILDNFAALQAYFGVNHVTFNAPSNIGKHNVVTFPRQAAAPGVFGATEFGLYNMIYPRSTVTELFVRRNAAAIGNGIPFTAGNVSNGAPWRNYTMLPSGQKIAYGLFYLDAAGLGTQIYSDLVSPTLLGPAYIYDPYITVSAAQSTVIGAAAYVSITGIDNPNQRFSVRGGFTTGAAPLTSIYVYWMAIGK